MKKKNEGFVSKILNFAETHEREIELGGEIALMVATGVMAFIAGRKVEKTADVIKAEIADLRDEYGEDMTNEEKEKFEAQKRDIIIEGVKDCALPVLAPIATCAGGVFCACKGYKDANKIIASLSAAYTFASSELVEYKDKLPELIGDKKASEVKAEVAESKVSTNPPKDNQVIVTGKGDILCYDTISGRYFKSDAETIRQKVNDLNEQLMDEYYISLNEFYYMLKLPNIKLGDELGFCIDSGKLRVDFSSVLTEDNTPVLVMNYDISPKYSANKRYDE